MTVRILTKEGLDTLAGLILAKLGEKQNLIEDLDAIRASAQLGATSLQKHQDISGKADIADTLSGYGITDAYTKAEIDEIIARLQESEEGHFFKAEENEF